MNLPESIKKRITEHTQKEVKNIAPVHGGDINQSARIFLDDGSSLFLKWNTGTPSDMFIKEKKGLDLLRNHSGEMKVPDTLKAEENFLLMEWLEEEQPRNRTDASFTFGKQLAQLHSCSGDGTFGLDHDNYIGRLPQSNNKHDSFADFYLQERLAAQVQMGIRNNIFDEVLLSKTQNLHSRIEDMVPVEPPALLHGDLWSGNYMFVSGNTATIYDPAVYFGHREIDIAMTRLFGGFTSDFYDGYNSIYTIENGFNERLPLFKLYPLLVHANLFGGSYVQQCKSIIHSFQ